MNLVCVHCDRPTIACDTLPPGWQPDRLTLLDERDIETLKRDFAALPEGDPQRGRAIDFSAMSLCPECREKQKPKPWEPPAPREKLLF